MYVGRGGGKGVGSGRNCREKNPEKRILKKEKIRLNFPESVRTKEVV